MHHQDTSTPAQSSSHSLSQKQYVLIDTDIGDDIDDALALALALHSPELELLAITTVFGDTVRRAQLATRLLQIFDRPAIPVAAGMSTPLQPRGRPSAVPQAAVLTGDPILPRLHPRSGPALIIQTALTHPQQLTLITIGPLTNIARAIQMEPGLSGAIRSIIMMGGTATIPLPEWNTRNDAQAARIVLNSGIPITLIGLNVTVRCRLREQDVQRIHNATAEQTRFLSSLLKIWQKHHPHWHPRHPYLHDPLTIAALCKPDLFRFQPTPIRVLTHGPLHGWTIPHLLPGPQVQAAIHVKVGETRGWIVERLLER